MKFVPYEKMSKSQQRAINQMRRRSWGALSPVTRIKQSKKVYERSKWKHASVE